MKTIRWFVMGIALLVTIPTLAQNLKQTPFEDETGSIGLPPGWEISGAYKGSVTCAGPNGAAVILKLPWTIMDPSSSVSSLEGAQLQPLARPGDLVGALREVLKKKAGATLKSVRGSRTTDVSPGVPAYYLLYEFVQNGKAMTGLGYFAPLDYGAGSPAWQLYSSAVVAPTAQFPKTVRTMLLIWRSWRPNGKAPREGSDSAIFDQIIKEKIESRDRISKLFREQL